MTTQSSTAPLSVGVIEFIQANQRLDLARKRLAAAENEAGEAERDFRLKWRALSAAEQNAVNCGFDCLKAIHEF